jgi:anti-sigma regulatory factor (Ser/Thr protein kinase)
MGTEPSVSPRFDELTILPNGAEVRRATKWLATACRQHDVPQALAERLVVCLHEVLANVITHGGATALAAPIRMRLELSRDPEGGKASVMVTDAGMAFDPLTVPDRILPKTLAEASPGGLGLVLIHRSADWLDYRHDNGRNHLTFGARWDTQ